MASYGWRTKVSVTRELATQYSQFNPFQLIRLLQRKPKDAHTGETLAVWPMDQRFRFKANLSSAFAGNEIFRLQPEQDVPCANDTQAKRRVHATHKAPRLVIHANDYCIAGSLGPLPSTYTEWIRSQEKMREKSMSHFLDMFNQRLQVLRYEQKLSQVIALNNRAPQDTHHATCLASLMGVNQVNIENQIPLNKRNILALAGMLSNQRRSLPVLKQILTLCLGSPITLHELAGAWIQLETEDLTVLGKRNHQLGMGASLGSRVWDQQARIVIDIGELTYAQYCRLLPFNTEVITQHDHSYFDLFVSILRLLTDRVCDNVIRLAIKTTQIPLAYLIGTTKPSGTLNGGASPTATQHIGMRLGQTAWLKSDQTDSKVIPFKNHANRSTQIGACYVIPAYSDRIVPL